MDAEKLVSLQSGASWRVQGSDAVMPNRYEREIEEILRNLEKPESKPKAGRKFGLRRRSSPRNTHSRSSFSWNFSTSEWLLIIAVGAALLAGGYAFATDGPTIYTGLMVVISVVCLLLIALSQFIFAPRRMTRYGNITNMSPLSRNPFSRIQTQWNLFLLKIRYRRKRGHE